MSHIKGEEQTMKKATFTSNAIKFSVGALVAFSEIKAVYELLNRRITTSDFAFYTASNALNFSSLFVTKMTTPIVKNGLTVLQSLSTPIVLLTLNVDIKKCIFYYKGHITKTDAIINIISNLTGLTASRGITSMTSTLMGCSIDTLNPVFIIVTGGVAIASYAITNFVVKKVCYTVVNIYDGYKEPRMFNEICSTICHIHRIK